MSSTFGAATIELCASVRITTVSTAELLQDQLQGRKQVKQGRDGHPGAIQQQQALLFQTKRITHAMASKLLPFILTFTSSMTPDTDGHWLRRP